MIRTLIILTAVAMAVPAAAQTPAFARPDVIRWGATTAELEQALKPLCPKMLTRPVDPPFLPNTATQVQIDCDGFQFMGGPRWAEFVIGDGRLKMVWIMVKPEERDAIVAAMRAAVGPSSDNAQYIAFPHARTAWRHQPAEVLFYSDGLASWAEQWFGPNARR